MMYNDVQFAGERVGRNARKLGAVVFLLILGFAPVQSGVAAPASGWNPPIEARESADLWENPTFIKGRLSQKSGWCGDFDSR
jgi:hypothetical protein